MKRFRQELEELINKHSLENGSDTPDFILAEYLLESLRAFDRATNARESWFIKNTNAYADPEYKKFLNRVEDTVRNLKTIPKEKESLEDTVEQLRRLTEIGNWNNMCARATLYPGKSIEEIPQWKPEDMVQNLSDRTEEEKLQILELLKLPRPVKKGKQPDEKENLKNVKMKLLEVKEFLQNNSLGNISLTNLPQYFWEQLGECIGDLDNEIKS